jgi:membrane peptidoglycan carboxypeptidase
MLKTVMQAGTGASHKRWGIRPVVAGKTGTTNDQKDAWFVGYTPDVITLVWVGYDDNTTVGMTGGQAALPIWSSYMKQIQHRIPVRDFPRPHGVVEKMIDPYTGKLATYSCSYAVREVFIKGTEPVRECSDSDHYLPIEYFLGPEPRSQQTMYASEYNDDIFDYTNYKYEQADISYDQNRYAFTNYGDDSQDYDPVHTNDPANDESETVDYSDESFPDSEEDNAGRRFATPEPQENEFTPVEPDYEAAADPSSQPIQTEERLAPQTEENAVYFAPKAKKKKRTVYTNKDIPEADTVVETPLTQEEEEDE